MKKKVLIPVIIAGLCAVGIGGYSITKMNSNTPKPLVAPATSSVQNTSKVTPVAPAPAKEKETTKATTPVVPEKKETSQNVVKNTQTVNSKSNTESEKKTEEVKHNIDVKSNNEEHNINETNNTSSSNHSNHVDAKKETSNVTHKENIATSTTSTTSTISKQTTNNNNSSNDSRKNTSNKVSENNKKVAPTHSSSSHENAKLNLSPSGVTIKDEYGTATTTGTVSINNEPKSTSNGASQLGVVTGTKVVAIRGKVSNGWYLISCNGTDGYISGEYLKDISIWHQHTEVQKKKEVEHKEEHKKQENTNVNITEAYVKQAFAKAHPNSAWNYVRNSAYYAVMCKLTSSQRENNSVKLELINKINNISDSQFKSIARGEDPDFLCAIIDYSDFQGIRITVAGRTFKISVGSIG